MPVPFPFSAIVGQDEMKRALLISAVDPRIGGVMVFGDRGTGKSTAVRALGALLPEIRATSCAYHCDPDSPSAQCDTCRAHFPIVPADEKSIQFIKIMLASGKVSGEGTGMVFLPEKNNSMGAIETITEKGFVITTADALMCGAMRCAAL